MALEKVIVSGSIEILKQLGSLAANQIGMSQGVKDKLKKLKSTLEIIEAVTFDAERKQLEDASVRVWLTRLRGIVYDADDLLDELSYEAMRRCEKKRSKIDKVKNFFLSKMLARKISGINKRLDDIATLKDRYMLVETIIPSNSHDQSINQRNRLTSSFLGDLKIVGREDDKSHIIKMLMTTSEKISVISIVGMGGLGKTTLAQMVYKDDRIGENFTKIWVCVSKEFDVYKILTNVIESVTEKKYEVPSNVDLIVRDLEKCLSGKKCLLVLDDLWNENSGDWDNLRDVLCMCGYGSIILITTRKEEVASLIKGGIPLYFLRNLSKEECWLIIKNKAFSPGGASETPRMTEIGEEIAERCGGLPLAANFLGSLMHSKGDESGWLSIRDHNSLKAAEIQNKIMSILKLSYDNLSSRLKQCFSYCSLFPRDWEINRETLIRLWMAEGFLHHSDGDIQMSLEDMGDNYFHSLLSWSFFQDVKTNKLGDIQTCKMHHFVHDLAKSVSGIHDIMVLGASNTEDVSEARRLQLVADKVTSNTFSTVLNKASKLRTIFSLENNCLEVENLLNNKCLRVVCLLGEHSLKIPSLTFKFKHLRYLDFSDSKIEEVHCASIQKLYNLQTLVLRKCIGVSKILENIGSLKNLRHLDLSCSDIKMLPDSIIVLTNLQTLDLNSCTQFEALHASIGSLKHLKFLNVSSTRIAALPDSLTCIETLSMVETNNCWMLEALPRDLGALTRLRCLDLKGTEITALPESCISNLCNLEMVDLGYECELPRDIKNWPKLKHFRHARINDEMPRGIEALTCLEILSKYMVRGEDLSGRTDDQCSGSGIEELSGLKSLQVLIMTNLENVRGRIDAERAKLSEKESIKSVYLWWHVSNRYECVDNREYDDDMMLEGLRPHPNLKHLSISAFRGLNFPRWIGLSDCLPNLTSIYFIECTSCGQLPTLGLLPCLRKIHIEGMKSVKCLGEEFYYQQESKEREEESSCSSEKGKEVSTKVSLFPSLTLMKILDMENLEEWVVPSNLVYNSFPSIAALIISDCKRLISTPVSSFSSLSVLGLSGTSTKMVHSMLVSREGGTGLSSLTNITIHESTELILFSLLDVLRNHNRLQCLQFLDCYNFQGFLLLGPDFDCSSSSLRSLDIQGCPDVRRLPDLQLWTSLRELTIRRCGNLTRYIHYDLKSLTFLQKMDVDFLGFPPSVVFF